MPHGCNCWTFMATIPEQIVLEQAASDSMIPELYRIERVRYETDDTFTFRLIPVKENCKISFLPGQFNMLYVFGVGEVPISISGDPSQCHVLEHTTRSVGVVTKAMGLLKPS